VSDWFKSLPADPEDPGDAAIEKAPLAKIEPVGGAGLVEQVVDQLFQESASIVASAMRFADIEGDEDDPPEQWIEQLGEKEAKKALRIAKFAQIPSKNAPIALEMAQKVLTGLIRAKMDRPAEGRPINIQIVQFEKERIEFPEVILDEKGKKAPRRA